jgi:hypothetical protein
MEEDMTTLLARAFDKANTLPKDLQDELARELMEEIEWELHWDKTLADTQEQLDQLAEKALRNHREGKTEAMGFDEL